MTAHLQTVRTPSGTLAIFRHMAERLLAEGVISGTLDGDLHAADAATVKAAIMAAAVCDFCSAPGASHHYDVPDFGITTNPSDTNFSAAKSTGGWMACDACYEIIESVGHATSPAQVAARKRKLVDRAVTSMAFPKFTRRALEELVAKFWQGMEDRALAVGAAAAVADYIEDRRTDLPPSKVTDRDRRIEQALRLTGLTPGELQQVLAGGEGLPRDVVEKLTTFNRLYETAQARGLSMEDTLHALHADAPRPPLAPVVPHWQVALDMRFAALARITEVLRAGTASEVLAESTDLNDPAAVRRAVARAQNQRMLREVGFERDAKFLRLAQAYSFSGDTIAAIREAAASLPHEAPLSSIETPNTGCGWFWFGTPLPVTASPIASDSVHGLLWGWDEVPDGDRFHITAGPEVFRDATQEQRERAMALRRSMGDRLDTTDAEAAAFLDLMREMRVPLERVLTRATTPAIMFSAYVVDERGQVFRRGDPAPSTKWFWPLERTFSEMLQYNAAEWERAYGAGSPHEHDAHIMGKDATLRCIHELSLFFLMACLWFKQTVPASGKPRPPVLTQEDGHVERHARKRYAREHKLEEPPRVRVVALRRSERTPSEAAPADRQASSREYACRWIVRGHPRLQACGPGRRDRKLIWIDAHPAGPEDKPLKTRETVYSVVR